MFKGYYSSIAAAVGLTILYCAASSLLCSQVFGVRYPLMTLCSRTAAQVRKGSGHSFPCSVLLGLLSHQIKSNFIHASILLLSRFHAPKLVRYMLPASDSRYVRHNSIRLYSIGARSTGTGGDQSRQRFEPWNNRWVGPLQILTTNVNSNRNAILKFT